VDVDDTVVDGRGLANPGGGALCGLAAPSVGKSSSFTSMFFFFNRKRTF
jgi:hypothetical protein